jgi:nitroimidazol reductase NimA-like FMN-containing flavoprotein (pyridoxamine 5'-phosphate oxidase superfamily)
MSTETDRKRIIGILDAADDLTIATLREDGFPQATTVSFVNDGLKIYVGTGGDAQKAKNMTRNDKVSVTVNLPYESWDQIRALNLAGRAHRVAAHDELRHIAELMFKKFPQISQYADFGKGAELALFRIDPEIVSVLDYRQGFGHADLIDLRS